MSDTRLEVLDEAECLRLIAPGGIGRLAFDGRFDLTVLPVNYKLVGGTVLFRTVHEGATEADLRTGIPRAEFRVAFEVDDLDPVTREGWSVLVQGPAHHVDSAEERAAALAAGVESWAGGQRDQFIRITPVRVTGRRIRH
ncbi:MAG TPA: pyridoxamine 5'-phosphate oxidase family protein [Streptosporangiaceae bacterium]|nr:pyridoxamine 5'-phosphate oxidase family protein [Streptosporangiaceae bacterium]